MTKYKLTKPLNPEEIGLILTIINFEIVGIDVTIDNLKRTTSYSKDEIQKIGREKFKEWELQSYTKIKIKECYTDLMVKYSS